MKVVALLLVYGKGKSMAVIKSCKPVINEFEAVISLSMSVIKCMMSVITIKRGCSH